MLSNKVFDPYPMAVRAEFIRFEEKQGKEETQGSVDQLIPGKRIIPIQH